MLFLDANVNIEQRNQYKVICFDDKGCQYTTRLVYNQLCDVPDLHFLLLKRHVCITCSFFKEKKQKCVSIFYKLHCPSFGEKNAPWRKQSLFAWFCGSSLNGGARACLHNWFSTVKVFCHLGANSFFFLQIKA